LSENRLIPIYLPDGQTLLAQPIDNLDYRLHGFEHEVVLSGAYAKALDNLIHGRAEEEDLKRLTMLEKHDWLQGLSCASTTPTIPPAQILTGHKLGMLFVELTDKCNEKCIHCYADSSPERTEFLPLDQIRSTLQQASEFGTPYLQFTGGDPLIHPHLIEAVAYASTLPFQGIEIYTNGLLINDRLLDRLAPYEISLSFSIYADSAEIHDHITQVPGSWKRTVDAMKRAKDRGIKIRAGIALMEENIACAEKMPRFLKQQFDMGPDQIRFDAVNQVGRGQNLKMLDGITPSHQPSSGADRRGKLCIAANGDVYPCIFARSFKLGNIGEHALKDIFAAMQFRSGSDLDSKHWNSCRNQLSCGDCRIIAYLTKGSDRA
jgi:radical SAM protein with 4Fe4S-binding SPASM domain